MLLDSTQATELLGVLTRKRLLNVVRLVKDHGLNPIRVRGDSRGGRHSQYRFTLSQLAGILVYHVLGQEGIETAHRAHLLIHIANLGDEHLEAKIEAGHRYVVKTGRKIVPVLWPADAANIIQRERADDLKQLGVSLEVIDLGEAIAHIFTAARAMNAAPATSDAEGTNADA